MSENVAGDDGAERRAHVLAVGELYNPVRTSYPTIEQVRLGRTVHELARFWPDPDPVELAEHQSGQAEFALIDESPTLLVLAYRFGSLPWCDAPFEARRHHVEDRVWPAGGPEDGIALRTVLVDSTTGLIEAMRIDLLSLAFSNAIRVAVAEQLLHPEDCDAEARLKRLYAEHPTAEELMRSRAIHTCRTDGPVLGGVQPLRVHHY